MSQSIRLFKNSGIYLMGDISIKAIGFFLIPLYSHFMNPSDYGILELVTSISSFVGVIYILSLHGSISRYYFDYQPGSEDEKTLSGTIITFVFLASAVLTIFLSLFSRTAFGYALGSVPFYPYMFLGLILAGFRAIYTLYFTYLKVSEQVRRFVIFNFVRFVALCILIIIVVVIFKMKAEGPLAAQASVAICSSAIGIYLWRKHLKLGIDKKKLKLCLTYALPQLPGSLTAMGMTIIDRICINKMITLSATGIYGMGYQFGNIINIMALSVNSAFWPLFMKAIKSNHPDSLTEIKRLGTQVVMIFCIIASGLSLFSREILTLAVNSRYLEAYKVIPFIAFAFVMTGVSYLFVNTLYIELHTPIYVTVATIAGAALNIYFNLTLIPRFGIQGAAYSILISQFIYLLIVIFVSRKYDKINMTYFRFILSVFVSLGISIIPLFFPTPNIFLSLLVKLILYSAIVFSTGLILAGRPLYFVDGLKSIRKMILNKLSIKK